MPYFSYNGRSCYYEEQGSGEPLLLLHGNTASSMMFYELASAFAGTYRTILLDFLGCGRSDRVERLAADLWYDEAMQVVAFLEQKQYTGVRLLGSSGGALTAINVALERPDLVRSVIADSFEGERSLPAVVDYLAAERAASKLDENGAAFYQAMHGDDWETAVDLDTAAVLEHAATIGRFFHRPLRELRADILLVGSREDEFVQALSPDFFEATYGDMLKQIGHGRMVLFERGRHPAALSNAEAFISLALDFFEQLGTDGPLP